MLKNNYFQKFYIKYENFKIIYFLILRSANDYKT